MRRVRRPLNVVAEINVVPYIDVMLVLLVIFMVTAPLLQQGVDVELPAAQAQTLEPNEVEPVVVSIDKRGVFYLNIAQNPNLPITGYDLRLRLAAELIRTPNRTILVKGDETVNYGQIVSAMVLVQQAGASSVGLVTQDNIAEG